MTPKKNNIGPQSGPLRGSSFTSLRIIGEKAQKLFAKAREMQQRQFTEKEPLPPSNEERLPEIVMHVSLGSVVRATFAILAIVLGVMLVWLLQDKIVLLLLSIFVAMVIDPGVQFLKRLGIPRGLGILIQYFVALFLLVFLLVSLVPLIASQLIDLASLMQSEVSLFLHDPQISLPFLTDAANTSLTELAESTLRNLSINEFADAMQQFGQSLASTAQNSLVLAAQLAGSVVNFFANLIIILVMAFFIQIEKEKIVAWVKGFLPWRMRPYVADKSEAIQTKMAQWARGQLVLCLVIGFAVFLALTILRMPYALTLAILAGFTEFIPVIGPLFAAVPAVLIAGTQQGFFQALIVAAIYYAIQWCENNLLVPLIMKRAVGLSPLAILFAMLVGVSFPDVIHPILGVILSIPTTTIIALFLEDWRMQHPAREKNKEL
ncbi:MAG: AI-2E family transporter [Candidatus Peribacteraceae bacterium]|nr:AI-2E family transporter [Candidatus Peribacteraceae bacterium]